MGDENNCILCEDGMKIIGDACVCEDSMDRPNDRDKCSRCLVEGCLSCEAEDEY